jgi:hypothetical protein
MNVFEEFGSDPYRFTNRLPDVLRSRLTSYFLMRTVSLQDYYSANRIRKTTIERDNSKIPDIEYTNIRSVFCEGTITISQKINEFYYSYVISKNRMSNKAGASKSFAICKKLYKEELLHLKVKSEGFSTIDSITKPIPHVASKELFKYTLKQFEKLIVAKYGEGYKSILEKELVLRFARVSFSDLATLKASARSHIDNFKIPHRTSTAKTYTKMKEENPEEFERRPKMLEALTKLVAEYESEGTTIGHITDMIPLALRDLESKDCFDSDLFPKSQHGGNREIHVLEVRARIVQYFIEQISKFVCGWFKSETITHPWYKDKFVQEHYGEATVTFEKFITLCKSADAKTWCQRHSGDRFEVMLLKLTPKLFHPLIIRTLDLWQKKRITLPMDLIAIFLANKHTDSSDDVFMKMRDDFYKGQKPFTKPMSHQVIIESGMFQGVLHYSSSLYHTMIQEVTKSLSIGLMAERLKCFPVITIAQGSDDSSELISVPINDEMSTVDLMKMTYRFLKFKEVFSAYLAVYNSEEKSAIGIANLTEYNSEWHLRTKVIKPTFRWVSACLEINLVETFIERSQIFNNVLTQVLEGGGSTFESSVIQLCQGWMHYKLLGVDISPLSRWYTNHLINLPDPSLGFFPLDFDLCAGVCGYDFSLFSHLKCSKLPYAMLSDTESPVFLVDEYATDKTVKKGMSSIKLLFGNIEIWKRIVDGLDLEDMEEIEARVDADPELVFGKHVEWSDDKTSIALKIFSGGVRSSLSANSPLIRMVVASAYMLQRPCFTTVGTNRSKRSLAKIIIEREKTASISSKKSVDILKKSFVLFDEYDKMLSNVQELGKSASFQPADLSRRSKVKIEVFESKSLSEYDILSLCKRKWFNRSSAVPVGNTHFRKLWEQAKIRCSFLRDTLEETREDLGMSTLQLKVFLEGLTQKRRNIKLTDTTAKSANIFSVLSRIIWPGLKMRSDAEERVSSETIALKSNLYAILSFPFKHTVANSLAHSVISESSALDKPWSQLNQRSQQLKIFKEFIDGTPRILITEHIALLRGGSVGFFTMEQKYNKKDKKYGGHGEWIGYVNATPTRIQLDDDKCTLIELGNINDYKSLAKTLRVLIKEMGCSGYAKCDYSRDKIYLNEVGTFTTVKNSIEKLVPVILNPDFVHVHLDNVMKQDWRLVTDGLRLKIVSISRTEGVLKNKRTTIMNYTSKYSDWDPSTECLVDYSTMFEDYYFNRESTRATVRKEFLSISSSFESGIKHMLSSASSSGEIGYFDLKKLRIFLNHSFIGTVDNNNTGRRTDELISNFNTVANRYVDADAVRNFARQINMGAIREQEKFFSSYKSLGDWAGDSSDIEEEESEMKAISEKEDRLTGLSGMIPTDEQILKTVSMLESTLVNFEEAEEILDLYGIGMPHRSRLLDIIKREYEAMAREAEISVREFLEGVYLAGDVEGVILSILSEKDRVESYAPENVADMIAYESSQAGMGPTSEFETIISEIDNRSIVSRMKNVIRSLESKMPLLEGIAKKEIEARINDLRLSLEKGASDGGDPEELNKGILKMISAPGFLAKMAYESYRTGRIIDNDFGLYGAGELRQWSSMLMRKKIRDYHAEGFLTEEDRSRYLTALNNLVVTEELLDIMGVVFSSNIRIENNIGEMLFVLNTTNKEGLFNTGSLNYNITTETVSSEY